MKRYIRAKKDLVYSEKLAKTPWSSEEKERTESCSQRLYNLLKDGGWGDSVDEAGGDIVEEYIFSLPNRKETEVQITKNWLVKVRHTVNGTYETKIPNTTFYSVADYGDVIDENVVGYATLADARHAAMIYIGWEIDKYRED